ncbi:MAG: hypothetical protein M1836_007079 [Candelina mexicana]|nr:MAG: hypothetical protein M1836_007079 [Candelina mexicana]
MSGPVGSNGALAKPPMKRSIFNKPSWSKPQPMKSTVDMFSRSNDTYTDIVAEEKRKRQERLARKEQQRSGQPAADEGRESKRRRLTEERDDDDYTRKEGNDGRANGAHRIHNAERGSSERDQPEPPSPQEEKSSPNSLSKRYEAIATSEDNAPSSAPVTVIDLEGEDTDDDEPDCNFTTTNGQAHPPPTENDSLASDEEFPELARKARERARLKAIGPPRDPVAKPEPTSRIDTEQPNVVHQPRRRSPSPPPQPIVKIFITSEIPDTNPLIVHRRLNQRLKDVKVMWCKKQGFTEDMYDSIHLTWRGHKLFNVTTCKSLGIRVDENENAIMKGEKDTLGDDDGRIHMEAMTDEMIQQAKVAREGRQTSPGPAADEEVEDEPIPEQKPVEGIKIILKSKGYDDFRLIVKPSTPISRIVEVFRHQYQIAVDKEVFLIFDGDRLDIESSVGDTDLSDLDNVEVHVK